MKIRLSLVFASLVLSMAAADAAAPQPPIAAEWPDGHLYTDADVALSGPSAGSAVIHHLAKEGRLAASQHRESAARINYGRALRILPGDRFLLWSYGWAALNLGQPAQALAAFHRNRVQRPDLRPRWVPMAMALSYTAAGNGAVARAWYRTAAASDPVHWGSDGATLRTTQRWSPRERALVRTLLARADTTAR